MDWEPLIQHYFSKFMFIEPLPTTDILSIMGVELPDDYLDFMHKNYGGEGAIGKDSYLRLFSLVELQEVNEDYCVDEFLANHCMIASSGSSELYGIDANGSYFAIPVNMDVEDKLIMGNTFVEFIKNIDSYLTNAL